MEIIVNHDLCPPAGQSEVEIVERKGLGHPDSMSDAVAEAFCRELCLVYLERGGHVLHHHVDQALLAAAGLIAERVVRNLPDVASAECRMVSAIGRPVDEPQLVEVRLVTRTPTGNSGLAHEVERQVRDELRELTGYSGQLLRGSLGIDPWPSTR